MRSIPSVSPESFPEILAGQTALIGDPVGHLAVLLTVLALIFWATRQPALQRVFRIIPGLVFCYFVPTLLSAVGLIPTASPLYEWVKHYVLPASLVLLTLALDLRGILRLGPKAVIMLLTGTVGIVIGGPIAYLIWKSHLPDEAWRQMAFLAGSWIGGGANALALQQTFGASDASIAPIIVVDVAVANIWTGVLLFLAGRRDRVNAFFGGDVTAIDDLQRRMAEFQKRMARATSMPDLMVILALAFGFAWLGHVCGLAIDARQPAWMDRFLNAFAWKVILVTAVGVALSCTRARRFEGAGASSLGSVMIYLLVATIGAKADFYRLTQAGAFLGLGATWLAIHIVLVFSVAKFIRAPFFFVAVGSQANVGGAASAPVVAGAFDPGLTSVGVLLAIAGYVLGTYAGLVCIWICRAVG